MKSGKGSHDFPPVKCLPPPLPARAPPVVPLGLSWQSHFLTPCGALQTFHSDNSGQRLPMLFSKRFFRSCQSDQLVPVAFTATPTRMLAAFPWNNFIQSWFGVSCHSLHQFGQISTSSIHIVWESGPTVVLILETSHIKLGVEMTLPFGDPKTDPSMFYLLYFFRHLSCSPPSKPFWSLPPPTWTQAKESDWIYLHSAHTQRLQSKVTLSGTDTWALDTGEGAILCGSTTPSISEITQVVWCQPVQGCSKSLQPDQPQGGPGGTGTKRLAPGAWSAAWSQEGAAHLYFSHVLIWIWEPRW